MVSDEQFNRLLIKAVEKKPVLYSVKLADYNNKNKKGEAFKGVQQELRELGSGELQVQSVYKRWISLKRKFRVEFFKVRSAGSPSKFHYFDDLKFLIPYCEYHGSFKLAKRKFIEDDDEFGIEMRDAEKHEPELECKWSDNGEQLLTFLNTAIDNISAGPTQCGKTPTDNSSSNIETLFKDSSNEKLQSRIDSLANFLSQSEASQEPNFDQNSEKACRDHLANEYTLNDSLAHSPGQINSLRKASSENALFGSLVANELDKLPSQLHNLVRAQVLILLAKANRNPKSLTSDKFLTSYNPF